MVELRAIIHGLQQALLIQNNRINGGDLYQVVIKADSEYLVKGMTEWVFKWGRMAIEPPLYRQHLTTRES